MKSIKTLTIGIPAYNEETNIKRLLEKLLAQKEEGFTLQKIVVVSDGSTDKTAKEVCSLKDKRVILLDDKKRLGKSARMEQLFRLNSSDVLILMDADIAFTDQKLFAHFLKRVDLQKRGLATVNVQSLQPITFFEHVMEAGVLVSKSIAEKWKKGNNYLTFKGCFLALDKKFVKNLSIPASIVNNDAYLYFAAKQEGYTPAYVKDCFVYYKSPSTIADHIKQSSRFQHSLFELQSYFSMNWKKEYTIPTQIMFKSILSTALKRPFYLPLYVGINVISKLKKQQKVTTTWSIARSTKRKIIPSN